VPDILQSQPEGTLWERPPEVSQSPKPQASAAPARPRLDPAAAAEGREIGAMLAEDSAGLLWREEALAAVKACCLAHAEFIVDDVWQYLQAPTPPDGRAMGSIILRAAREGWCEGTPTYRPSAQPQCHANPRRVWRSKLHQPR
jgi:hypothetical protein